MTQDKLQSFIDAQLRDHPIEARTADEALAGELIELAQSFELDPQFDAILMQQFQSDSVPSPILHPNKKWQIIRLLTASAAMLILLSLAILFVPPLRAVADDIIQSLFPPSDVKTQKLDGSFTGASIEGDILSFLSLEEAQQYLNFSAKIPAVLPDSAFVDGIHLHQSVNTLSMVIRFAENSNQPRMMIYQQPLKDAQSKGHFLYSNEEWTVGQTAIPQKIMINDIEAEFIQGNWVTSAATTGKEAVYIWSDNFPTYRLRWMLEGILYEVKYFTHPDTFKLEDFIQIAESMMQ